MAGEDDIMVRALLQAMYHTLEMNEGVVVEGDGENYLVVLRYINSKEKEVISVSELRNLRLGTDEALKPGDFIRLDKDKVYLDANKPDNLITHRGNETVH